ncbi:DUF86 domain-containing protein [Candidatus Lokiarchaeum ossiferum]|uniref:DUF86 domain-containing protein n=1 Tax=Candidatus Lokiarchaeum ossiferum TaxID=2951803 RepID=UPI00352FB6F1
MKEERKQRYFNKLHHFGKYLSLLSEWIGDQDSKQLANKLNYQELFGIYHAFQLAMEVVADLASMISKDSSNLSRDDYSNYHLLYEKKIISEISFKEIKDLNGLRNRIVHDYNGLVDNISLEGILESLISLPAFKEEIEKWLAQN